MKKIMYVVKTLYKEAFWQLGLLVVNLLVPILLLVICFIDQYFNLKIILFSFIPFLISAVILFI